MVSVIVRDILIVLIKSGLALKIDKKCMTNLSEIDNDLSLQDRIAAAHVAFYCAEGAVNKAVKWREYARLRREQINEQFETRNEDSMGQDRIT